MEWVRNERAIELHAEVTDIMTSVAGVLPTK